MSLLEKVTELLTGVKPTSKRPLKKLTERELIELESEIGRNLFGPIPKGHTRDFFCLDDKTWVWHEAWKDDGGKAQASTIRYEVQPTGILKVQSGRVYNYIEGEELKNLTIAVRLYYEQTMRQIYKRDPVTGRPMTDTPPATI